MNAFLEALGSVLTIFIFVIVGYILQNKKKITKEIGNFLCFIVVNITLPCSIYNTITTTISFEKIDELPFYVGAVAISQVLSMLAALVIANLFKIEEGKKGTFIALTAFNNTLFMGMPVSVALFGDRSTPVILYYYISSTLLFWTIGVRAIIGKSVNKVKVPTPMYGVIIGFLFLIIFRIFPEFKVPKFLLDSVSSFAKLTTPLSMIFTGYALGEFGLKNIRFDKNVTLGLIARFIVSPIIFIAVILVMKAEPFYRNVFIVQAFMPVMASQTIIARQYGIDDKYPAVMVTTSTLISLLIIPIVKVFVS